jgi:hypothetical protein
VIDPGATLRAAFARSAAPALTCDDCGEARPTQTVGRRGLLLLLCLACRMRAWGVLP